MKCIVILSTKSTGSSALQEFFCQFGGAKHVRHTRHAEHETLFWTKAASVLRLPQVKLPDSEVPIARKRAAQELHDFLSANTDSFAPPTAAYDLIFSGWHELCRTYSPVFIEKSPHHLHQRACLDLILMAAEKLPDVDFRFVGLVRNPMDVLYSAWTRWSTTPESFQHHWKVAHDNLLNFREGAGERLTIVRYEDLIEKPGTASTLLSTVGLECLSAGADRFFHGASRSKWKLDESFGFCLHPAVARTAFRLGYSDADVANVGDRTWPLTRTFKRAKNRLITRPLSWARRTMRRNTRDSA
jgi:hypothetical protein